MDGNFDGWDENGMEEGGLGDCLSGWAIMLGIT
jgi:hypothetical protein